MKNYSKKNSIYIFFSLFFVFLLFMKNSLFKKCILDGCSLFLENVFPSLFPMFLVNDILMNYNFYFVIEKSIGKIVRKIFGFSSMASYIFIMSMFSGTPTNAYLTANLVKEKKLSSKDASIILTYSCFLNPLFLYTMLQTIFHSTSITLKLMLIQYGLNFLIAFLFRNYPYEKKENPILSPLSFSKTLSKSLKRSMETLLLILGTILFYFLISEAVAIFFPVPLLQCFLNGILEATGGLAKLILLNVNIPFKEVLSSLFISFGGLSIHTQIKNIIQEENISYHYFFLSRIFHALLSTLICIVIS